MEHSWREYECMAREYMMAKHPGRNHYIISGTHGSLGMMHGKMHDVVIPKYYWKAQCFVNVDATWAWAIIIPNVNDDESADESTGKMIIPVSELSEKFLGGPIFDDECQKASLGPWKEISENWENWQTQLGCHFPAHEPDNHLRFRPKNWVAVSGYN